MPTLTRAKNGDWFARKVIPPDVRDAYQRAYGIRHEERFRAQSGQSSNAAKLAYTEWLANVEGRIATLRSTRAGEGIELTSRQAHEIAGRWYDWFLHQHADGETPAEHWDHQHERYEDAVSRFGGPIGGPDDVHEDAPRGTAASRHIRTVVGELAMLATFLADEGVSLSTGSYGRLVDVVERDLSPAMATLRRRAGGDYRPDTHRERFPQATEIVPANAKLSGWNAWDAFEAWAKERKPAAATVNRWRGVFLNLKEFMDGRDIALLTDEEAVRWKDALVAGGASARTINDVPLTAARRIFGWAVSKKRMASNPFTGLKVATGRTKPTSGEFTEADVETILRATLAHQSTFMSPYLTRSTTSTGRCAPDVSRYTSLQTAGLFMPAGGIQLRTTGPITWEVGKVGSGWLFTVPARTLFDVSTPRPLWPILTPRYPRFLKAAALDEEMLRQGFDRLTAASAFNAALAADDVAGGTRFAMTLVVAFYRFV